MRKHFTRIQTDKIPEYKAEIEKMYKEGCSSSVIGKHLRKDRSTIYYWFSKMGFPGRHKRKNIKREKTKKVEIIEGKETEREKELAVLREEHFINKQEEEILRPDCCLICHKEKDFKWRLTDYCGIECWDYTKKRQQNEKIF